MDGPAGREPARLLPYRGLLSAAIVDRLTFGGNLIQTGTDSYRLALTQARVAAQDNAG